jgi:hypothetical protein
MVREGWDSWGGLNETFERKKEKIEKTKTFL